MRDLLTSGTVGGHQAIVKSKLDYGVDLLLDYLIADLHQ